jgi:GntR family transcriptional regulator
VGGLPVEYARDLYRADRVRLMVRTEVHGAGGARAAGGS